MLKILILISILFSNMAFAKTCDIEFKKLSVCGEIKFVKEVSRKYSSDFTVKLTKNDQEYSSNAKLVVYLNMKMKNGHEHGSTDVLVMKRKTDYLIQDVWFLMNGSWEIRFELRQSEKVLDKASFNVCVGECKEVVKIQTH